MMQKKHYLSFQVTVTTVITNLIAEGVKTLGLSLGDLAPLVPGAAVAISHFIILGLASYHVPSLDEVRFNTAVKRKKKLIGEQLKTCTPERRSFLLAERELLDQRALEACTFQVESIAKDLIKEPSQAE
ncbi:MAG: hypothetical protein WBH20_15965 [Oceanisphaera sp.]|uniref:hypothetical protein n=1 Tax=Oceanisphaera sp. TaxID=1929979 RepID=UPI003C747839